jgi:hypothetical protein
MFYSIRPKGPEYWKKIAQILGKVAKTGVKTKITKISTSKLNLKVQNIYIEPLLKPKNTCNKSYFETTYLGEILLLQ